MKRNTIWKDLNLPLNQIQRGWIRIPSTCLVLIPAVFMYFLINGMLYVIQTIGEIYDFAKEAFIGPKI